MAEYEIRLPSTEGHPQQEAFVYSPAKRIMVRAGRRGGKTIGAAIRAVEKFLRGRRVLYAAPTEDQVSRFWVTVNRALEHPVRAKVLYKNETKHIIETRGTENRIRAKTAWNYDTLRGDYADELILDEFQLMCEDAWELVGAPMLVDNNGNAVFIYTPPSLHSRSTSKAIDPRHASKRFERYHRLQKTSSRYATFHFKSMDNPHISREALEEISEDMTSLSFRMEILAEEVNEAPGALWKRADLEKSRVAVFPELERIVVAVDPSATSTGDDAGIVAVGKAKDHGYVLADKTLQGSPLTWAQEAVALYHLLKADRIVAEANQGGEMVTQVIKQVDPNVPVRLVHASRGKQTRAEPVAALSEQERLHLVGKFDALEDEMCLWVPGDPSPNRMDALVWGVTELMITGQSSAGLMEYYRRQAEQAQEQIQEAML